MSAITAATVNELRKRTNQPLMECKSALKESNGDMEEAVLVLRRRNKNVGDKRGGNETAEGRIGIYVEPAAETAAIVEMRCESAPTAKNDQFVELAYDMARQVASAAPETVAQMMAQAYSSGGSATVQDRVNEVVGLVREKMIVQRFERIKAPVYGHYVHHDGTVGVLIGCTGTPSGPTDEALRDVCAHAAALNPQYLTTAEVPAAVVAKERDLAMSQIQGEPKNVGKPANIIEKIAEGKVKTALAEIVLSEQPMANTAKYPGKTVGQVLQGLGLTPIRFVRYKVGATAV